jgi:hypothetical protein
MRLDVGDCITRMARRFDQEGKRLLMFSNNGNYEKDIVRFSGTPFEVSYTGENIVAVTASYP